MNDHSFLIYALSYLTVAVIAVPLFRRLGLGSVLGYLAAGGLIGPWGLRVVHDPAGILQFSELGVVLLLFLIGLELSPLRLWVMRRTVFGLGIAQVAATSIVFGGIAWYAGLDLVQAGVVGASLSLSSTAFALQTLEEHDHLATPFGRSSFGILLFQDLAAIPLLAIVPLLAQNGSPESSHPLSGIGKVFLAIGALIFAGRYLLQPVLRLVTAAKMREITTAAALLLVLAVSMLMESIGISMSLGSFLAGVLLADSEHRHELQADIEPFKGLLLGLFFTSVGMSIDFGLLIKRPVMIAVSVVGLVALKTLILYVLGRVAGLKRADAGSMAATISQGGEFAFVVLSVSLGTKLLPADAVSVLVLVVALSMVATPLLVGVNDKYVRRLLEDDKLPYDTIEDDESTVIIAGFGRFGQMVGRVLRVKKIRFTALDYDQQQVNVLRKFGNKVYYGDASRIELLDAAGAKRAKYFVLAIDNVDVSLKTAEIVRQHYPDLKILARARNRQHAHRLYELGIKVIHRETFESSLALTKDLLAELGFEQSEIIDTITKFRTHDEALLAQQFKLRDNEQAYIDYSRQYGKQLADLFEADRPGDPAARQTVEPQADRT